MKSILSTSTLVATLVAGLIPMTAVCQSSTTDAPTKNNKEKQTHDHDHSAKESSTSKKESTSTSSTAEKSSAKVSDKAAATQTELSKDDAKFLETAAVSGVFEVEAGKLAVTNGSTAEVKDIGKMMIADHTKANTKLMSLGKSKGVTLPTAMDEKFQGKYDKLAKETGADFDKAYIKAMVASHKANIALFEARAKKGDDADITEFATKTLPKLQAHLTHVQGVKEAK